MKRKIINIDEVKCNGCGLCIPECHEGALQVIDGKARLISDLFCDGLGACLGYCPEGAISIEEREAEPYNERKVMEIITQKGTNTILAHLEHLRDHNEQAYLREAIDYINEHKITMNQEEIKVSKTMTEKQMTSHGCPGSMSRDFRTESTAVAEAVSDEKEHVVNAASELRQWPVQLHLLNPMASYFQGKDVILTADCVAFAMGNFHAGFLKGKSLAIACPKLDTNKESYIQKLTAMMKDAMISSLKVIIMEVPCCGGLVQMAKIARDNSGRTLPIQVVVVSVEGEIIEEEEI
jgi:NAD-dependent dihydropyrimidine dehydrogenase PreA subunit